MSQSCTGVCWQNIAVVRALLAYIGPFVSYVCCLDMRTANLLVVSLLMASLAGLVVLELLLSGIAVSSLLAGFGN